MEQTESKSFTLDIMIMRRTAKLWIASLFYLLVIAAATAHAWGSKRPRSLRRSVRRLEKVKPTTTELKILRIRSEQVDNVIFSRSLEVLPCPESIPYPIEIPLGEDYVDNEDGSLDPEDFTSLGPTTFGITAVLPALTAGLDVDLEGNVSGEVSAGPFQLSANEDHYVAGVSSEPRTPFLSVAKRRIYSSKKGDLLGFITENGKRFVAFSRKDVKVYDEDNNLIGASESKSFLGITYNESFRAFDTENSLEQVTREVKFEFQAHVTPFISIDISLDITQEISDLFGAIGMEEWCCTYAMDGDNMGDIVAGAHPPKKRGIRSTLKRWAKKVAAKAREGRDEVVSLIKKLLGMDQDEGDNGNGIRLISYKKFENGEGFREQDITQGAFDHAFDDISVRRLRGYALSIKVFLGLYRNVQAKRQAVDNASLISQQVLSRF